jgi:hypothetical protein
MAAEEEVFEICQECGATVYPEHLTKGLADRWEDRLLCVHCLRAKKSGSAAGMPAITIPSRDEPINLVAMDTQPPGLLDEEPGISYEKKPTAIRSIGGGPGGLAVGSTEEHSFRRDLLRGSPNATRCKTFHCKLADGPMNFMNEQINDWVDGDEEIEIKFATATIGVVEGKHVDPHLIVTVYY